MFKLFVVAMQIWKLLIIELDSLYYLLKLFTAYILISRYNVLQLNALSFFSDKKCKVLDFDLKCLYTYFKFKCGNVLLSVF